MKHVGEWDKVCCFVVSLSVVVCSKLTVTKQLREVQK